MDVRGSVVIWCRGFTLVVIWYLFENSWYLTKLYPDKMYDYGKNTHT